MASNLAQMFLDTTEKYGDRPAFWSKDENKEYQPTTFRELYEMGIALSEALIDLGVKAKDHVAILADNRLEWIIADYAVQFAGAADVPRGTDVTDGEIQYILNHSGAKVVFVEHDKMYEKFKKNKAKCRGVKTVIMMDKDSKLKDKKVLRFYDLIEKGKELRSGKRPKNNAEKRIEKIRPEDLFTLIYTSGTTGMPKGVMLMHSNMIHQTHDVLPLILPDDVGAKDSMLSILPVWHIFERVVMYGAIYKGVQTYYTKVTDLRNDFAKAKPTFMASAPRVWESVYTGIYGRVNDPKQTNSVRRFLFKAAYFFSKHYHAGVRFLRGLEVDYDKRNIFQSLGMGIRSIAQILLTGPFTVSGILAVLWVWNLSSHGSSAVNWILGVLFFFGLIFNYKTLDSVVLSKIRMATGGRLRATLSGGGALQRHVDEFFNNIGLLVLEGYGMTETGPTLSVRPLAKPVIGSVGFVVPKTEIKIVDDAGKTLTHINDKGELLAGSLGQKGVVHAKGPQVMKGYYKNPEATKKAMNDGWMDTGDIGFINYKKTLTLSGRAKETIVLLGGENVEPVPIENRIDESPYIKQSMVIGQDQKVLGAIIVPELEVLKEWATENGIDTSDPKKLLENPKVNELYKKEIRFYNNVDTGFKSFEQVQRFIFAHKPFEVGDELTNLMKMKRHIITEKYSKEIKKLYER